MKNEKMIDVVVCDIHLLTDIVTQIASPIIVISSCGQEVDLIRLAVVTSLYVKSEHDLTKIDVFWMEQRVEAS